MDELIKCLSNPSINTGNRDTDTDFNTVLYKSKKYESNIIKHETNIIKMLSSKRSIKKNNKNLIIKQYEVIPIENVITIDDFDNLDVIYSLLDSEHNIENIKVYCGGNLLYEQNNNDFMFDKNELLIGYHGIPLVSLQYQDITLKIKIKEINDTTIKINISGAKLNNYDTFILKNTQFDLDLSKN